MVCWNLRMDMYEQRRIALQALVDAKGRGGIARIAHQIGKDPSYVSRMLYPPEKSGYKRIGEDTALLLVKAFPDFFRDEKELFARQPSAHIIAATSSPVGIPAYPDEAPEDGYVRLPVMAEASAGPGSVPMQEVIQPVDVLESYIRQKLNANPRNLKVLTARGGSMTGLIEDGDIMFVEPTTEFTDDGIYILTLDDLVRVKRLSVSMTTGNVLIESNDGRKSEELPLREVPDRLHIQGRVLGAWSLRSFG